MIFYNRKLISNIEKAEADQSSEVPPTSAIPSSPVNKNPQPASQVPVVAKKDRYRFDKSSAAEWCVFDFICVALFDANRYLYSSGIYSVKCMHLLKRFGPLRRPSKQRTTLCPMKRRRYVRSVTSTHK
jgi:hypothetical protein